MVARSGDGWVIAPCLAVLFDQLDAFAPDRPKASDGSIGDARHQAESFSDHNPRLAPDGTWYVTAGDVTATDWVDSWVKDVLTTDTRVKYLIWRGQYWQRINWDGGSTFEWRAYNGTDPHTSHVHISVRLDAVNDKRPWGMPAAETGGFMPDLTEAEQREILDAARAQRQAVGYGQSNYPGTIKALLAGIQSVANRLTTLAGRVDDLAQRIGNDKPTV